VGSHRNYPFNCWWVAAASEEVSYRPLCRWLLERRVVLFRTAQGSAVALEDRCAHRWAPLSKGKVIGDEIACPYHGFRYNVRGTCTHVPTQTHIPAALKVRSYPVREHGPFVWIWMGNAAHADPALLPSIQEFTDPAYFQVHGYFGEAHCNYMLIHENVLDVTHIEHLHAGTVHVEGLQRPPEVTVKSHSVTYSFDTPEVPLDPLLSTPMGLEAGQRVRQRAWGSFVSPACHYSGIDIENTRPAKGQRVQYCFRGLHCVTPIGPHRCHYWWANAQDYGREGADLVAHLRAGAEAIYQQDRSVVESIQETIERDEGGNTPEILVAADRAAVEARRIVDRLVKTEDRIIESST